MADRQPIDVAARPIINRRGLDLSGLIVRERDFLDADEALRVAGIAG